MSADSAVRAAARQLTQLLAANLLLMRSIELNGMPRSTIVGRNGDVLGFTRSLYWAGDDAAVVAALWSLPGVLIRLHSKGEAK